MFSQATELVFPTHIREKSSSAIRKKKFREEHEKYNPAYLNRQIAIYKYATNRNIYMIGAFH